MKIKILGMANKEIKEDTIVVVEEEITIDKGAVT